MTSLVGGVLEGEGEVEVGGSDVRGGIVCWGLVYYCFAEIGY